MTFVNIYNYCKNLGAHDLVPLHLLWANRFLARSIRVSIVPSFELLRVCGVCLVVLRLLMFLLL